MSTLRSKLHPKDGLGRRNRYLPEADPTKRITARALQVAQYNHMMGGEGLGTPHLFRAGTHANFATFEKWMSKIRGTLFEVGDWQLEVSYLNRTALINRNKRETDELLKKEGMFSENVPMRSGAPKHDAFQTFGYCSFNEMLPPEWTIELQHSVLDQHKLTQEIRLPSGKRCKPDAFVIVTSPFRTIVIFQEYDRAHEQMRRSKSIRESWEDKLDAYEELIETKYYRQLYGLPDRQVGAVLCVLTTSDGEAESILKVPKEGKRWLLTQAHPGFGREFWPPTTLLDVYNTPWKRRGADPYIFSMAGESRS